MGEGPVVWLAVFGGIVAAASAVACACACAWLARATNASSRHASQPAATTLFVPQAPHPPQPMFVTMPSPPPAPFAATTPGMHAVPVTHMAHVAPMSLDRIPDHVVMDRAPASPHQHPHPHAHPSTHAHAFASAPAHGRAPLVLEGRYPQLGAALGTWLQVEPDEVERIRIARDLGTIGGAGSARALLDGVRTGVLSPTIASDQLERGGFEAGITVAAALRDPEPRVRALASSLVGRTTPLEPARMHARHPPSMPEPPTDPRA